MNIEISGTENLIIKNVNIPVKKIVDLISSDITRNVWESTGIDGTGLKPLSEPYRTIKAKKGRGAIFFGLSNDPIKLRWAVIGKMLSNYLGEIFLNPKRKEIGGYVNKEREFFGVSQRVLNQIDKEIEKTTIE